MVKKRALNVLITAHQAAELDRLAAANSRNKADLVRDAIDLLIADLGGTIEDQDDEARRTTSNPLGARVANLERRIAALEAKEKRDDTV